MRESLCVAITYFNEKGLLAECLNSLLNQTEIPDEILLYDDASDFPAKDYIPKAYPIKIFRGEVNKGIGYARNALLSLSQSSYIHFHDADDLFCPYWCAKVKRAINTTKADIIITEVSSFKGSKMICEEIIGLKRLPILNDFARFALNNIILPSASTVKKDIAVKIGGYRNREIIQGSEDFDFHVRFALTGVKHTALFEPLVKKRLWSNNFSAQIWKQCWVDFVKVVELLSAKIPLKYRQELAEAAVRGGHILFKLGAPKEAGKAFKLAHRVGVPIYAGQRLSYRLLAKAFGPMVAEYIGLIYRSIFSEKARNFIIKRGI